MAATFLETQPVEVWAEFEQASLLRIADELRAQYGTAELITDFANGRSGLLAFVAFRLPAPRCVVTLWDESLPENVQAACVAELERECPGLDSEVCCWLDECDAWPGMTGAVLNF